MFIHLYFLKCRVVLKLERVSHFVCRKSTSVQTGLRVFTKVGFVMALRIAQTGLTRHQTIVKTSLVGPISFSARIGRVFLVICTARAMQTAPMDQTKKIVVNIKFFGVEINLHLNYYCF